MKIKLDKEAQAIVHQMMDLTLRSQGLEVLETINKLVSSIEIIEENKPTK